MPCRRFAVRDVDRALTLHGFFFFPGFFPPFFGEAFAAAFSSSFTAATARFFSSLRSSSKCPASSSRITSAVPGTGPLTDKGKRSM